MPINVENPQKLRSSQDVLDLLENNQRNADISLSSNCSPAINSSQSILVEQNAIKPPLLEAQKYTISLFALAFKTLSI